MADDIVTRLRTVRVLRRVDDSYPTLNAAADEIERLRALIVRFVSAEVAWQEPFAINDEKMIDDERNDAWAALYEEAVRG